MSRSPTSVHTNSEMESEINRFSEIIAENNTISMLASKVELARDSIIIISDVHPTYYSILYVERYICI